MIELGPLASAAVQFGVIGANVLIVGVFAWLLVRMHEQHMRRAAGDTAGALRVVTMELVEKIDQRFEAVEERLRKMEEKNDVL